MNKRNLHIIQQEGLNLLYLPNTYDLILVNNHISKMFSMYEKGVALSMILNESEWNEAEIKIFKEITELSSIEKNYQLKENKDIDKITLFVSNDCNLRCRYCYANGGDYKMSRNLMTQDTAMDFINFCVTNFTKIRQIVFFGGEPMLNINIMEFVCLKFKQLYKDGIISYMPIFSIITNGTILNSRILNFLKENISTITVSIDGPKEINDANRIYTNGEGSYSKIEKFIHTIVNETNITIYYEATYNHEHLKLNYTKTDISNELFKKFGIKGYIIPVIGLSSYFNDDIDNLNYSKLSNNGFSSLPDSFWGILHSIIYKKSRGLCPMISRLFSVNSQGNIYPCHALNGTKNHNLGHINRKNVFNDNNIRKSFDVKIDLMNNDKCNNCWCKNLCGGCPFSIFYDKSIEDFTKNPSSDFCVKTKQYIEHLLILIARIRKNPEIWKILIEKERERNKIHK